MTGMGPRSLTRPILVAVVGGNVTALAGEELGTSEEK